MLDTEPAGLDPAQGHRSIGIGCVELVGRRPTGEDLHCDLRPDREIGAAASAVHGIDGAFLADKPRFAEVAATLIEFLAGAEVLIHNAPFDVGFIDAEFARMDSCPGRLADHCRITDTLEMARRLHPGQRNGLDALCKRYSIDNSHREWHGALLDAGLLADVYLAMTGGQATLELAATPTARATRGEVRSEVPRGPIEVVRADAGEVAAHQRILDLIERTSGACVWTHGDE